MLLMGWTSPQMARYYGASAATERCGVTRRRQGRGKAIRTALSHSGNGHPSACPAQRPRPADQTTVSGEHTDDIVVVGGSPWIHRLTP